MAELFGLPAGPLVAELTLAASVSTLKPSISTCWMLTMTRPGTSAQRRISPAHPSREPGYEEEMRGDFELLLANQPAALSACPVWRTLTFLRNIRIRAWLNRHRRKMQREGQNRLDPRRFSLIFRSNLCAVSPARDCQWHNGRNRWWDTQRRGSRPDETL